MIRKLGAVVVAGTLAAAFPAVTSYADDAAPAAEQPATETAPAADQTQDTGSTGADTSAQEAEPSEAK